MSKYIVTKTFEIGESQTNAIFMNERTLTGVIISASTISGSLMSFLVSTDNINYVPLLDSGNTEITITTGSKGISLVPEEFIAWNFIKARLGTSGSNVLQASYDTDVDFILDSL